MPFRKTFFVVLALLLATLLGSLMMLGGSSETTLSELFGQNSTSSQGVLTELGSALERRGAFFSVILNWKLIFFAVLAIFGTIIAALFIVAVIRTSRESLARSSLQETSFTWKHKAEGRTRRGGLVRRIRGSLSTLVILLGLAIISTVGYLISEAIQNHVHQRALTTATILSEAAAPHIVAKDVLALHTLFTKYSVAEDVAYIFIIDDQGKLLAHNLPTFPAELQRSLFVAAAHQRTEIFGGEEVLESRVPINDGQLGVVYFGIWKAMIDKEIRTVLLPIVGLIVLVLLAGVLLSIFFTRRVTRPILQLVQDAERLSRGDLDTPVGERTTGELRELARSLERIRSSLKAAIVRLNRQ